MAANPERRTQVCDAALELLGRNGSRAVTHRAVDAEAGLPTGTTSNYFPSRAALFLGMCRRLFQVLAPEQRRLEELGSLPVAEAGPEYVGYIVERLLARPNLARSWFELRIEAMRSPEISELMASVLQEGFMADVAFHEARGLTGGRAAVTALHHLVDGAVFDALTVPIDPQGDPIRSVKAAARVLFSD